MTTEEFVMWLMGQVGLFADWLELLPFWLGIPLALLIASTPALLMLGYIWIRWR